MIQSDVKTKDKLKKGAKKYQPLWQSQFDQLFPETGPPPTEDILDLTLISYLLNTFCGNVCTNEEKEAIKTIRELRNELAHDNDGHITDDAFLAKWNRGVNVILLLNPTVITEVEKLKTGPVDETMEEEWTALKLQYEEERKMGLLQMAMWEQTKTALTQIKNTGKKQIKQMEEFREEVRGSFRDLKLTQVTEAPKPGKSKKILLLCR